MATHSSTLAWRSPWTEEPGGHSPWNCKESDVTKNTHTHTHTHSHTQQLPVCFTPLVSSVVQSSERTISINVQGFLLKASRSVCHCIDK